MPHEERDTGTYIDYAAFFAAVQTLSDAPAKHTVFTYADSYDVSFASPNQHLGQVRVPSVEQEFERLASNWTSETRDLPSLQQAVLNENYQRIITMNYTAVPLILKRMRLKPDHWFWALRIITGEDPVPANDRGNIERMTNAWLKWGTQKGFLKTGYARIQVSQ